MPIDHEVRYSHVDDLFLDPMNPRLGRHDMGRTTPQDRLLELMEGWVLDELAWSYLESGGFWAHEAVIAVHEELYGREALVVVGGNRRVAALKMLQKTVSGHAVSKKWFRIIEEHAVPGALFEDVPYLLAETRADVDNFLGFRHVTGIKPWKAEEKAEFIARLIDDSDDTFKQVAHKIGSKAPAVRRHYVAYKLLLEMESSSTTSIPSLSATVLRLST